MAQERLQKILAHAGVASRRAAEKLILAGRVRVNGKVMRELGVKADPRKDKIEVDGRRIVAEKPVYYLLHKPKAVISTMSDPEGRETVADYVRGITERVFPVGRLDYHTSGALLMTNDGAMAQALLRPAKNVPKTYVVKVKGLLKIEELDRLRNGIQLDDGYTTKKADLFVLRDDKKHTWVQLTLTEGKNRQVHRMFDALGYFVQRLSRTEFAGLSTEGLRPGEARPLAGRELDRLKKKFLNPKKKQERDLDELAAEDPFLP